MMDRLWTIGHALLLVLLVVSVASSGTWAALALWYRLPGGKSARALASMGWILLVLLLAALAIEQRSWWPWPVLALLHAVLLLWWVRIVPSSRQPWRDDVARLLTGTTNGNHVQMDNVRNFRWRSKIDYDARWERREYDLSGLTGADAVLSY